VVRTSNLLRHDLGLLAEQADPDRKELLGNYPQAFSQAGLSNAAWRVTKAAAEPAEQESEEAS